MTATVIINPPAEPPRRICTALALTVDAPSESEWPAWALQMKRDLETQIREQQTRILAQQRKINEMADSVSQTEAARSASERALELYGESDGVKTLTTRLSFMLPNAKEIGDKGVALVAQVAVAHGLDPLPGSDHIYAWKQGEKLFVTLGYKGLLHLARQQVPFTHRSRQMTDVERIENGLKENEIGCVTELYEITKAAQCKAAGLPYFPVVGVAVWRPGERVPTSRTAAWVAKKNSLKDALRQITATGQRIQGALDAAFNRYGMQFEADNDHWSAELFNENEQPHMTIESAVASGLVPADSDEDEQVVVVSAERPTLLEPETKTEALPSYFSDSATVNSLVKWARESVWKDENLVLKHAQNRVAKALGASDFKAINNEYHGSKEAAASAIRAYQPIAELATADSAQAEAQTAQQEMSLNADTKRQPAGGAVDL